MSKKSGLITVVVVLVFGSVGYGQPWAGSGDANDPYQIWDAADMNAVGADANYWDAHFELMADIDLGAYTGTSFNIIGYWIDSENNRAFTGIFDGNGHTISNFTYQCSDGRYIGMFGFVEGPNTIIKDLGLIIPHIDVGDGDRTGALVALVDGGTITNCYVQDGVVYGDNDIAGLVATAFNENISHCFVRGIVSGDYTVAGLVGYHSGTISNCFFEGGVVGLYWPIGGLVGQNVGTINYCYASGSVNGGNVGGLVGENEGTIFQSYSTSSVESRSRTGGLVGVNHSIIRNCYATGPVFGPSGSHTGGLVGMASGGDISYSYAAGPVSGSPYFGGFVGVDSYGSYTKCFWDSDVSPDVNGIGYGTTDPDVVGLPTVLMQTASTFTDAGWDFVGETANGSDNIWRLCNEGAEYPQSNWGFPLGDFICPDGVNLLDFAILGDAWLSDPNTANWDPACDISEPNDNVIDGLDLAVFVNNWLEGVLEDPNSMVWVYIEDLGVPGHEGFNGYMSKYETTNTQYCQYLNAALASGDITVGIDNIVYGASGSNSGVDFDGEVYYDCTGLGYTSCGATNGGAARINWTGSSFTVDSGFENYPITYVSWYGSTAFASYYSWRLPTEWEWQAVADYDGTFDYGCGLTIDTDIANYYFSTHPYGTTVVGTFGAYGYGMCDMAGNVWEWTSSCYYADCDPYSLVIRGGCWSYPVNYCTVSNRSRRDPDSTDYYIGFRVCR
jgi:hypothetical protein